jgi:hypothetical protein
VTVVRPLTLTKLLVGLILGASLLTFLGRAQSPVTITLDRRVPGPELTAPDRDVAATNGVMLGGAVITGNARWQGRWKDLGVKQGRCRLSLQAASAAVVKFSSP